MSIEDDDVMHITKKELEEMLSKKRDDVVKEVQNELLKQLHFMVHTNGYPSEAVPKATILSLPALMKIASAIIKEEPQ